MVEIGWRGHRHLLSIDQFSRSDIEDVLGFSRKLRPFSGEGSELSILRGRILKPMFFEPSSRTIDRHTGAILTMGGKYNPPLIPEASSMEKGESEEDTVITAAQTSDILAIRHPERYAPHKFAKLIDNLKSNTARVINCGDGSNEHPTQTLLDFYTIAEELGTLDGLTWLIVGDLEYGRTVHSLVKGIQKFSGNKVIGFPVDELRLPQEYRPNGYHEFNFDDLANVASEIPRGARVVLYATRVQVERIARKRYPDYDNLDEIKKKEIQNGIYKEFKYQITFKLLDALPEKTRLSHPLPRGNEIGNDVFNSHSPKVVPIGQMRYGLPVTMAYLALFSGLEEMLHEPERYVTSQPIALQTV